MKVLIVGTYLPDQQYSLIGFAHALKDGLPAYGVETRLVHPKAIFGRFLSSQSGVGKWLGHLDKVVFFPWQLRQAAKWADVVHLVDHGLAIYVRDLAHVPHLVTCHDLIAMRAALGQLPEWATKGTAGIFQKMILSGLNAAQHVVCISKATQADLCRLTKVPIERTTIVYDSLFHNHHPVEESESRAILSRLGLPPDCPFILHIGRNVPTKNRMGVLKIFAELRRMSPAINLHLVMAGKPLLPEYREWITKHNMQEVVHELSHVKNEELRALYSRAKAMVFPSFYEGFGLPIIEAQACGCPVFTSNRAPMTEVGGEAAVYFDPAQPEEAAHIIAQYLDSTEKMAVAGLENIKRFSTNKMLEGYHQVYERLLS